MKTVLTKIGVIDCGNECDMVEPYGFVPEAECSLHDNKNVINEINRLYGKHCLQEGEVFGCNNISYVRQMPRQGINGT